MQCVCMYVCVYMCMCVCVYTCVCVCVCVVLSFTVMAMSHWTRCVKQGSYYLQFLCVFMNMGIRQTF